MAFSLIILLGPWHQGHRARLGARFTPIFASTDSLEAYTFTVDYARGETRAQYIGQPNYNEHAKLPRAAVDSLLLCRTGVSGGSIEGVIVATIFAETRPPSTSSICSRNAFLGPPYSLVGCAACRHVAFPGLLFRLCLQSKRHAFFGRVVVSRAVGKFVRRGPLPRLHLLGRFYCSWSCRSFHLSVLFPFCRRVGIILALAAVRLNVPWLIGGALTGILFYVALRAGENGPWLAKTPSAWVPAGNGHWWGGLKAVISPWNLLVKLCSPMDA